MDTSFAVATATDIELLLQLMREYYAFDHLPFDEQLARTALEKIFVDSSLGGVWMIQYERDTVGYLAITLGYSLEYGGRDAFIDEIYIRENYRGRGIGQRALAFAEDTCRSFGVRALHLEVEHANATAYNVYRKGGFIDHERYLMTKRLHS